MPPIPVPISVGGGGGIAPSVFPADCARYIWDRGAQKIVQDINKVYNKLKKTSFRDPLDRKKKTREDIDRARDNELGQLRRKITELERRIHDLKKSGQASYEEIRCLREDIAVLKRLLDFMTRKLRKIEGKLKRSEALRRHEKLRADRRIARLERKIEAQALEKPAVTIGELMQVERQVISESLKEAVPYLAGSVAVSAGTYYLVPDRKVALKAIGYGTGITLGAIGLYKLAPAIGSLFALSAMSRVPQA